MSEGLSGAGGPGEVRRAVRWSRVIGFVLGVGLLGGALLAVERGGGSFAAAFEPLRSADPLLVAALVGSILLSSAVTAGLLWVLTSRYGRVGRGEMWALINAAWLLNYLPVRPGMFGRLAYHRAVNGIRVIDSAKGLVWANVLMLLAAGVCGAIAVGAAVLGARGDHWGVVAVSVAPIPALAIFAAYARRRRPDPDPEVWRVIAGAALAYAAQLFWAGRALLAFRLMGVELTWGGALGLAAVMALAAFVPITGNGLGVREWVIGLVAPLLPAALARGGGMSMETALNSMLVDRGAELLVAVPMGLACGWWVVKRSTTVRAPK